MPRDAPIPDATWRAHLALAFERRGTRTVLAGRRHEGPLVVQKALHPEGGDVCHAVVVHPPGGIAGGDELTIDVNAAARAHALLTTPGAAKWYRSSGAWARQDVRIHAGRGAIVEWLPQESIVFDGARAHWRWEARIEADAALIAVDVVCLGRTGSGETFTRGEVRASMRLVRDGRPLWIERACLEPGSRAVESEVGLAGHCVSGTLLAAGPTVADETLAECRALAPAHGEGAVTRMPHLLVARYRGDAAESARRYLTGLWSILRPALLARAAVEPRIWRT